MAEKKEDTDEIRAQKERLYKLVLDLGYADLNTEAARREAAATVGTPKGGQASVKAFEATRTLEGLFHQVLECGRAMALAEQGLAEEDIPKGITTLPN